MPDNDFLAFQYASGLLSAEEKQAIKRTPAFEQRLKEWEHNLTQLNTQVPLDKKSVQRIWRKINAQIKPEKTNIIQSWIKSWRYTGGAIALGLLLSVGLFNQNVSADLGWNIVTDLPNKQLLVSISTHRHTNKNNICTLWVKKGYDIAIIGQMPEVGDKTFNISPKILSMIEGGEIIISFEDRTNPSNDSPSIIEYHGKWRI